METLEIVDLEPIEEIEELGDEAIIAQQSQAHLPQKRANVRNEARSVVIAEEPTPASSRRPPLYRAERAEATLVLGERRDLEAAMRRNALEHRRRLKRTRGGYGPLIWAGLAIAAFAAGGLVTLAIVRSTTPASLADAPPAVAAAVAPPAAQAKGARRKADHPERAARKVQVEELPLEAAPAP